MLEKNWSPAGLYLDPDLQRLVRPGSGGGVYCAL